MGQDQIEVRVGLVADSLDSDELEECALMLGQELALLDVDAVEPLALGTAPSGSKGLELFAVGALVVKIARSGKGLLEFVNTVRDWRSRSHTDSIRLEIDGDVLEVKGVTTEERTKLIDAWVARHTGP